MTTTTAYIALYVLMFFVVFIGEYARETPHQRTLRSKPVAFFAHLIMGLFWPLVLLVQLYVRALR